MSEPKPPIDDDDDFELELEPVDPEILRLERERAQQRTDAAVSRIDINEVYDNTGGYSDLEVDLSGLRQFRFTTQHLLILTAVLAIVLTLLQLLDGMRTIAILAAVMLAGGWWWASRLERKQDELRRRRQAEFRGESVAADDESLAEERAPRSTFRFAFSTKELLITTGAAAVTLGLLHILPDAFLSMTLGLLALGGLAAHAMGFDPPRQVVLGWWILLVMYLAVGVLVIAGGEKEISSRSTPQLDRMSVVMSEVASRSPGAIT